MAIVVSPSSVAKGREIVCLQDKVSEVQKNAEKKANDLEKKLEGKDQLLKKAKKVILVVKGKLLKKEAEAEELNSELLSTKGRYTHCNNNALTVSTIVTICVHIRREFELTRCASVKTSL